jgi:hypothetical protein
MTDPGRALPGPRRITILELHDPPEAKELR